MVFQLPKALQNPDDNRKALEYLRTYYEERPGTPLGTYYTGARFDAWDSAKSRERDVNRFTADDLVAVTFLSVAVPPKAAWELLIRRPGDFNKKLETCSDRDLVDVNPHEINEEWPAWKLWNELRKLDGVDRVIAGKLLARKRPRLIPVYDRIVKAVTGGDSNYWEPLCRALRADDKALHRRLLRLRSEAGLSQSVSALRVFDVIAWMEGRNRSY
jgi:hypothetical protein